MASLVKTGISDGQTLTAVMITDLYDAFMGLKSYDNIAIKNYTLKKDDDNFLNYGNNNAKNLFLLLLEDL